MSTGPQQDKRSPAPATTAAVLPRHAELLTWDVQWPVHGGQRWQQSKAKQSTAGPFPLGSGRRRVRSSGSAAAAGSRAHPNLSSLWHVTPTPPVLSAVCPRRLAGITNLCPWPRQLRVVMLIGSLSFRRQPLAIDELVICGTADIYEEEGYRPKKNLTFLASFDCWFYSKFFHKL